MTTYELGSVIRLGPETFTDITGALVNPNDVSVIIKKPDGTLDGPYTYLNSEVTRESLGVYHRDYEPLTVGNYTYKWASTGTGQAARVGDFDVRDSLTSGALVSVEDLRAAAGPSLDLSIMSDPDVQSFIDAAVIAAEVYVGPITAREVIETVYSANGDLLLRDYPVLEVTEVAEGTSATVLDASGYTFDNYLNAVRRGSSRFTGQVRVTYQAGRSSVGEHLRKAITNHALNAIRRQRSSGTATFGEAGFVTAPPGLDNIVMNDLMLDPYFRGTRIA